MTRSQLSSLMILYGQKETRTATVRIFRVSPLGDERRLGMSEGCYPLGR